VTRIAVVDHGAGNLVSIARGLERAGAAVEVAADPSGLRNVDGVVLPGVGTTAAAMHRLEKAGLVTPLTAWPGPLLGICVGLQLFFDRSDEHDGGPCLGVVGGVVRRLHGTPLLPHIGWNDVSTVRRHPLFDGIENGTPFYFVHSYAPDPDDPSVTLATATYGDSTFAAVVASGGRVGVQFHPERSGRAGLRMLGNFVAIAGAARAA
jgi:glutamine amidotransferase